MNIGKHKYFDDRGFGERLESIIEMCHFLIHHNFASVVNPFELPICQLKKHYEFQNLILRNKLRIEIQIKTAMLNAQNGEVKGIQEIDNLLKKRDTL